MRYSGSKYGVPCRINGVRNPEWLRRYRVAHLVYLKKYAKEHPTDPAKTKAWRIENPAKSTYSKRNATLNKLYGIRIPDYESILAKQKGLCGLCGRPFDAKLKAYIDHDHKNGHVRGLLCNKCNSGMSFVDNVVWNKKAQKWKEKRWL